MLDWRARIDDLAHLLAREYAVEDRAVIEVLLSALIECPRTAGPWLILETNWYSRDCQDGWFAFGGLWMPSSLARIRARYPWREIEAETKEWLDSPSEQRLFIEPDFERFPYFSKLSQAQFLLQRSLRVRTRSARAADPLRSLDKFNQARRADELAAATSCVLEDRIGARPSDPPRFREPAHFLYHVELVQRLAPWYLDWHSLVRAFGLVAIRHAYLDGRTETDPTDDAIMARLARDSVPLWITKALRLLLEGPSTTQTIEKYMALEDKTRRSGHGGHRELVRLARAGVVKWNKQAQHWELLESHREGIAAVLDGRAFGEATAAAPAALRGGSGNR